MTGTTVEKSMVEAFREADLTAEAICDSTDLDERLRLLRTMPPGVAMNRALQDTCDKVRFARACWRSKRLHETAKKLKDDGDEEHGAECAVRAIEESAFARGMWYCRLFPSWVGRSYEGSKWYKAGMWHKLEQFREARDAAEVTS